MAGRTGVELDGLVGMFVNMLVLRTDLSGDPSFLQLLERTRETTLGAYQHQEVPFERLVEELAGDRSAGHSPLFQVGFGLHRVAADARPTLGGLVVEGFGEGAEAAKFDLDLALLEEGEALGGTLSYRASLFEGATVVRMVEHFRVLLAAVAADPARRISELPLLAPAERERVLVEWNRTAAEPPRGCVHELFAARAAAAPGAVALVAAGEAVTYAELDARADHLARRLRRRGVGPEVRVGICLERSAELIVALLGVLKAGGVYVPLDPAYPAERLRFMLEDSGSRLVLTRREHRGALPAAGAAAVVELDAEAVAPEHGDSLPAAASTGPQGGAYVIYTSGSTGTPKGVLATHGSLAGYALAAREFFELTPSDRVLQFASVSFDTSAEEIYPALLAGATLVLRDEEMLASAAKFLDRCGEWGITVLDLPTAYWHELASALERGEARLPGCVRLAVVGGERMLPERVAGWLRCVGGRAGLVNGYGPTETTIVATLGHVLAAEAEGAPVSIGRPVANVRTYVLEPSLEPAPAGVPGELWIGGAGVARGYLGRPEQTAAKFAPDPYSGEPGARMYRSGDRVRWRAGGELEYLGRMDGQVKIRGFRVEPGEVEAVVRTHEGVREAVVRVREDVPGDRRLVAYVVPSADPPSAAELREHARGRLPGHMVPSAFVLLEALPLTPSGKLDAGALPAPVWVSGADDDARPPTATEQLLVDIWIEVIDLGVGGPRPRVGVHDNFFEMGGHSLLATQVVARVHQVFGVELPVRAVFEAPTVAALAERVDREVAAGVEEWVLARELEHLEGLTDDEVQNLLEA